LKKKTILIIFVLLTAAVVIFSFPKPKRNKAVSGIIGKIQLDLSDDWYRLEKDIYTREFYIDIINNTNGKKRSIYADKMGFFYLLNISPGEYTITQADFIFQTINERYNIRPIILGKDGIHITIEENSLFLVGSINIRANFDEENKKIKTKVDYKDNKTRELKEYFLTIDKKGFWKDFTFANEKNGSKKTDTK